MEIEKFHSTLIKHAENLYQMKKEVPTACFGLLPSGNVIMLGRSFDSDNEKDYVIKMYSMILLALKVKIYSFVCEFYFYKTKDADSFIRPSQHPDRAEGLGVFTVSKNGEKLLYNVEIKNQKIIHDENISVVEFGGRFCDLFIDITDEQHNEMIKHFPQLDKFVKKLEWVSEIDQKDFFDVKQQ